MTLIGKDQGLVRRALRGMSAALVPRRALSRDTTPAAIIGHRGSEQLAPENTVLAAREAIDAGADGVEVDLCVTSDGQVVLWHDRDPSDALAHARRRGADGTGFVPYVPPGAKLRPVSELTLAELRAGYGYSKWELAGTRERVALVETFDEFVEWLASEPRARVAMFDVKLDPLELRQVRPLVATLARVLVERPELLRKKMHVLCPIREVYRVLDDELRRHALGTLNLTADCELPGVLAAARELGARHVALGITLRRLWSGVRNEAIDAVRARRRGQLGSVTVWTVDDAEQLADMEEIGVDNVIVADPLLGAHAQNAVTST